MFAFGVKLTIFVAAVAIGIMFLPETEKKKVWFR
jgi:hypothetical protein